MNCSARSVVSGACARLEEVQIRGYGKYLNKRICKAVEANMMPTVSSSLTSGDCEFFFTRTIRHFTMRVVAVLLQKDDRYATCHIDIATEKSIGLIDSSGERIEFFASFFVCITEEMKATDSFDRNNLVILERLADVFEHFLIMKKRQGFAIFVEGKCWSTAVTGYSLGMKTAISWVGIFFLAVWTHHEITHRRSRTIIRTGFCHGEAWATRRTSEKKIVMSAILWISEFFETIVTEKYIWWNLTKTITSTFPKS